MVEVVRKNWKWLLGVILFVWILISLPYILMLFFNFGSDYIFLHNFFNVDSFVYYQYINQIRGGGFLIYNQFNPFVDAHGFFNIFWFFVGKVGFLLGLDTIPSFVFSKYFLSPFLVLVSFFVLNYVFKEEKLKTRLAHVFLLFGGGLGYVVIILRFFGFANKTSWYYHFVDMWATEISPYLSIFETPHFIASWTLLLLSFYFIFRLFETEKILYAWYGSLVFGALSQFHPYYIPVVTVFFIVSATIDFFKHKNLYFTIKKAIVFAVFPSISVGYFLYAYITNDLLQLSANNNVTITPSVLNVAGGFGFLLIITIFYITERIKQDFREKNIFLFVFLLLCIQFFLLFFPYPQQRRNLEGINFSLAILTTQALVTLIDWKKIKKISKVFLYCVVSSVFFTCIFFFINYSLVFVTYAKIALKNTSCVHMVCKKTYDKPPVFLHKDEYSFLKYLNNFQKGVFLTDKRFSYLIPSLTHHNVISGHWAETIDFKKNENIYEKTMTTFLDIDPCVNYVLIDKNHPTIGFSGATYDYLLKNNFFVEKEDGHFIFFMKQ